MDNVESSVRQSYGAIRCQALEKRVELNVNQREIGPLGRYGNLATNN